MKKHTFGFLLATCVTTSIFAQAPSKVGAAENVQGLVTVSQGNTMGNLVKDTALVNGARVATTSTGSASLVLANGCRVDLAANQAVTIDTRLDCKALVASIQPTGSGVAGVAGGNSAAVPALAAGALGIILLANQKSSGS